MTDKSPSLELASALEFHLEPPAAAAALYSPKLRALLVALHERFDSRRHELLAARESRQAKLDSGWRPDFLEETEAIRAGGWTVAPLPADLLDRRVEITGPVDRKMIINALNSGAKVFMADLEDSNAPTWDNVTLGQQNLFDAVRRTITFEDEARGKSYALNDKTAVLMVRPRGWHLDEKHVTVSGAPLSGSLFDFATFMFHNAAELLARGTGPYFYLPKLESHLEARLWDEVIVFVEEALGLEHGVVKVTVLIETLPAAFEMDEILYELRDHMAGLNCGRWDYIFSFIKRFRADPAFVLPDRGSVGMDRRFLSSYSQLLIQTCHKRGAFAMGGMAAQIPIKGDEARNAAALEKVRVDKEREARNGHDGTWVAHPGLVGIALAEFDKVLGDKPNQLDVARDDVHVVAEDLLAVPAGEITEAGLRQNLNVGVRYLAAWLGGSGCVPIFDLMEDAATAEISRTQVWQWVHHGSTLADGRAVTAELVRTIQAEELARIEAEVGSAGFHAGHFERAAEHFRVLIESDRLAEFLTLAAYEDL
jgi:malate synthase